MILNRQVNADDISKAINRAAFTLLPSYVQNYLTGSEHNPTKFHATSSLNGLRGIAALFVFFFHTLFSYEPFVEYGFGVDSGTGDSNRRLIQLPFIRLFFAGHAMVAIFFVVGGYVMSIKPLNLIHSGQNEALLESLVSSVFRRGIRLYLPAITATFSTMLTVSFGLWEYHRQYMTEDRKYIYYEDHHPKRQPAFAAQIWDWTKATAAMTNIFAYYNDGFLMPYYNAYDPHLWTVPFEYRSSLIVTLVTLTLSRCQKSPRLILMMGIIIFCGSWDRWEVVCFLCGSLLCNINSLSSSDYSSDLKSDIEAEKFSDVESMPLSSTRPFLARLLTAFTKPRPILLFTLGLYFLSAPNLLISATPGYTWLSYLTPATYTDPKRFPHTLGAILITHSLITCPFLQKPFNTPFAQYLGRISYSLYIVHGPLIHIVGYSVTPTIWWAMGGSRLDESRVVYWAGLVIGSCVLGIVVAVVSDLFYRLVDVKGIKLAKLFESLCFQNGDTLRHGRLG